MRSTCVDQLSSHTFLALDLERRSKNKAFNGEEYFGGFRGEKGLFICAEPNDTVSSCLEPFMFHFTAHFTIPLLPSAATEYISLVVLAVVMFLRHSSKMQNNNNSCDKS